MSELDSIKRRCSFPGCENRHDSKGFCTSHRAQLDKGRPLAPLRRLRKRMSLPLIKYREVPCLVLGLIGPCHEWTGYLGKKGYARVLFMGRMVLVHRYVWELANGPISDGFVIDHQCRNRACCNVDHLRVVTRQVNNTENIVGANWQIQAAKTHCLRGHEFTEENTLKLKGSHGRRSCRACAKIRNRKWRQKCARIGSTDQA